jgi:hypothetical protein
MSDDLVINSKTPKELAYWMLHQLYGDRPNADDWYINIRCIHNEEPTINPTTGKVEEKTKALFNKNIPLRGFKEEFLRVGGLYDQLNQYNINPNKPCNIYFGVNPRNHAVANHKKHCEGSVAFYLDLDDNKNYTKEQRLAQINFWIACGYWPSFVLDSGRGYHAYWVLKGLTNASIAEPLLKRIVAITGCKAGGSTWDITRVLRLPGFYNQKRWYAQDQPYCGIVYPEIAYIEAHPDELMRRYTIEELEYFPVSETKDIERYTTRAASMEGDLNTNLMGLVHAAMKHRRHAELHQSAVQIANEDGVKVGAADSAANKFEPTLEVLPPELNDVPFPRNKAAWMKLYCLKGLEGLTPADQERIIKKTGEPELSASELDYRIIYALVSAKYTKNAIREFWIRPGLKLWRPDKEARSPQYFDMTYDKALVAVRSTIAGTVDPVEMVRKAAITNHILVNNYETFFKSGDSVRHLFNGEIILKRTLVDKQATKEDEREYLDCEIRCLDMRHADGHVKYEMVLPRKAFNSIHLFRSKCRGMMHLLTDKASDLSQFLKHIHYTYPQVPIEDFHSKVVFTGDRFVFPRITIFPDRFDTTDMTSMMTEIKSKFPWADNMVSKPCTKDQIRQIMTRNWDHILNVHCPPLVSAVMGSIAASAARAVVETQDSADQVTVPTVNLRGGSTKGKSLTLTLFNKICGFVKPSLIGINNTNFAITRLMDVTNYMPTFIDEFKLEQGSEDKVRLIRDLVRRSYTGEDMLRGHRDLSLTAFRVRTPMIVSGETQLEQVGNVSEFTRVFPVEVGGWKLSDSEHQFDALSDQPLFQIGPHFYQFLLNEDKEQLLNLLKVCQRKARERITPAFGEERVRVGQNIGALIWGCKIWDRFVASLQINVTKFAKRFDLETMMCDTVSNWALESGQSLHMINKNSERIVVSKNELFDFLNTISDMIQMKHQTVTEYEEKRVSWYKETNKLLYLRIKQAYSIYVIFCLRQGRKPVELSKVNALIASAEKTGAPWYHKRSTQVKIHGTSTRCVAFDLQNLKSTGIWEPTMGENISEVTPTGAENTKTEANPTHLDQMGRFFPPVDPK